MFDFNSGANMMAAETLPVSLKVYNAASQYRNEMIGEHQLDLKGVYAEKGIFK